MYKKEEVYNKTLNYFNFNELSVRVWMDKYCLKDKQGNILEDSPDDTITRLASEFYRIEQKYPNSLGYNQIYSRLKNFNHIIPGGSILYGVGNNHSYSSLGNCFVIGNKSDSYSGIMLTDEEQAQLMKRRGGVGHDISHLRHRGSSVSNSAGSSTGAVSFMERYSNTTREVAQDGRRGALMITIKIDHPDIEEFITVKDDLTKITGANISIKIDDEFMECVEKDRMYPMAHASEFMIKARELWDKIIHQAWKTAEPGILFWDKIISESPADCYEGFKTMSTNPCGEIPLSPYDSCRLLSLNLYSYVKNPFTNNSFFDFFEFVRDVKIAQRLMDDIIDLEEEKIDKILDKIDHELQPTSNEHNLWVKIKNALRNGRRTGLSAIGLGDMLAALGYKYGTPEATIFTEKVYQKFAISAYTESVNLAKERGAFPIWELEREKGNPYLENIFRNLGPPMNEDQINWVETGRRNIALLTIPPSGTISMMAQISSGIEPVYEIMYKRRRKVDEDNPNKVFQDASGDWWEEHNIFHPKFIEWYSIASGLNNLVESKLVLSESSEEMIEKLIKESPYYKATSSEIDYIEKIKMQGAIQKWIDHSISVTHNLPEDITEEEVSNIYMTAWKEGCKGVTIYRDGSRTGVLSKTELKKDIIFKEQHAPKRPKELKADYHYTKSQGKEYAVIVGLLNDKPYEIFAFEHPPLKKNTTGVTIKLKKNHFKFINGEFEIENLELASDLKEERFHTIYSSGLLRHGAPIKYVVKTIRKTDEDLVSFGAAIRRVLSKYIIDGEDTQDLCECGNILVYQGGCLECKSCGYSKCS